MIPVRPLHKTDFLIYKDEVANLPRMIIYSWFGGLTG